MVAKTHNYVPQQVDFKKSGDTKQKNDERSVSAVPPTTVMIFEKKRSAENRAKSCNPESKHVTNAGSTSKATRRSSDSSNTKKSSDHRDAKKGTKRYAGE